MRDAACCWKEACVELVGQIQIASKRKGLELIQSRLDAIISPEARRDMEIEAIKAELGV